MMNLKTEPSVVPNLGTGFGGGLVYEGKVFSGRNHVAGELAICVFLLMHGSPWRQRAAIRLWLWQERLFRQLLIRSWLRIDLRALLVRRRKRLKSSKHTTKVKQKRLST